MVSRRNTGRADGHDDTSEENSGTTQEVDNPVLQQIIRRMDQLQQQNQTLQQQNQTLQMQVITLAKGQNEEEISEGDIGEFHPFSTEIAETLFPSDFREPPLKDYDGTTDPQTHVTTFKTQMLKRGLGDAIQCKLFSGTLLGAALIWFSHLPPPSISGIQDLLKKFLAQFSARRLPPQAEGPKGPDLNKWCDYHRARGHDTEDCWTVMNRIERLIKEVYLGRYMEKRKNRGERNQRREEGGSSSKRRREDRHKETKEKEEVRELDPGEDFLERRPQPTEELEEMQIGGQPEQKTRVISKLEGSLKENLIKLLKANADLFA
ncbi:hypothetical protein SESBI_15120 [Sesbania bispinosa]|nr:hypothetical protein SESBI_15120 [Sesbania bispinosa]